MDAEKLLEAVLLFIFSRTFPASPFNPEHIECKKAHIFKEMSLFVMIDKIVAIVALPWRV